jgi:hypothetical protein
MKLRFHSNSLRLRLSQSDVARLAGGGSVEEIVTFAPGNALVYSLESGVGDEIAASFENGRIRVTLPAAAARRWIASDEAGMEGSSGPLHVLVEKDFQCIHRESEEDADSFPNPLAPR